MNRKIDPSLRDILKTAMADQRPVKLAPRETTPNITVKGDRNVVLLRGSVTIRESLQRGKPHGASVA